MTKRLLEGSMAPTSGAATIGAAEALAAPIVEVEAGHAGLRLDALLSAAIASLSRTRAASHIQAGHVRVSGVAPAKVVPGLRVRHGMVVEISVQPPPPSELTPWHDADLSVVYEDADLVVIDKRAGLVVHPGAGHWQETLVHALLAHAPEVAEVGASERPGLVHRIDKDTSGLLVVSKTATAHAALAADFARHTILRRYVAVVLGRLAADRLTVQSGHARHPTDRRRFTGKIAGPRQATSHLTVLARSTLASCVVAELETGRTHQIRMHLAERGHPIAGDALYGGQRPLPRTARGAAEAHALAAQTRQALHAYALGFRHPRTGEMLRFHSAPPDDMASLLASLFPEGVELPRLDVALPRARVEARGVG